MEYYIVTATLAIMYVCTWAVSHYLFCRFVKDNEQARWPILFYVPPLVVGIILEASINLEAML